jgi:hypothetical protein
MSTYLYVNAWREILARLFDGTPVEVNVSPEWLVNPATRRKLKLDYLYPEIGVAVRFSGLTAKGQRRRGDWEAIEDEQRDETRVELCRLNGVQLAVIDPFEEPAKQMDALLRIVSRASRLLAQSNETGKRKKQGMDTLSKAHQQATRLHGRLSKQPEQTMGVLAEGWQDREAGLSRELQEASVVSQNQPPKTALKQLAKLREGQRVLHSHFGNGVVISITGEGNEQQITILFDADKERTFLLSLVAGKLSPLS